MQLESLSSVATAFRRCHALAIAVREADARCAASVCDQSGRIGGPVRTKIDFTTGQMPTAVIMAGQFGEAVLRARRIDIRPQLGPTRGGCAVEPIRAPLKWNSAGMLYSPQPG